MDPREFFENPDALAFRGLDIHVGPDIFYMQYGDYYVQCKPDHSEDYCDCKGGTKGGVRDPIRHRPGEKTEERWPCKHLRFAWTLAEILWTYGARIKPSKKGEPVAFKFESLIWKQEDQHYKKVLAKAIASATLVLIERCVAAYNRGERLFTTDLIMDITLQEARKQTWKNAVPKRLVREGYWRPTGTTRNNERPGGHSALIREYAATEKLVALARLTAEGKIKGRGDPRCTPREGEPAGMPDSLPITSEAGGD